MQFQINRRRLLTASVALGGLGTAGTAWWLSQQADTEKVRKARHTREPHFQPRATNVIFLFMAGAPSQVDLFDHKPALVRHSGQMVSLKNESPLSTLEPTSYLWPTPYQFKRCGQSGAEISELLPHIQEIADELCIVRSMISETSNHHPGQQLFMTGVTQFGHPSIGAWLSYGLGSENEDMPGYIVLSSGQGTAAGANNWSSGFLPARHQGVPLRTTGEPIAYIHPPDGVSTRLQRETIEFITRLNSAEYDRCSDPDILDSIEAHERAFKMQLNAPELLDTSSESKAVLDAYGLNSRNEGFALNCLLARRLVESGVRFVQLNHSSWDAHTRICENHEEHCREIDRPIAALIRDLRERGMLEETLVIWGGEFGRTPTAEHRRKEDTRNTGRDHQARGFTVWMAGGGFKPGLVFGATNEIGLDVAEDPVHVHDLQATVLHCLGLDHQRFTYPHLGRDQKLTDTGGHVVSSLLS